MQSLETALIIFTFLTAFFIGLATGIGFSPQVAYSVVELVLAGITALVALWLLAVVSVELLHARWRTSLATADALAAGILAGISFYAIPNPTLRAIAVIVFTVFAAGGVVALLAIVVRQIFGRSLHRKLAFTAAAVLAFEIALSVGLNTAADNTFASTATLIQRFHADMSASVALADAIAQGHAPADATFATVQTDVTAVAYQLRHLAVPSSLLDYAAKVRAWSDEVVSAAAAAQKGSAPTAPTSTPAPFAVDMTDGEVDAALAVSLQETARLIEFGNYAMGKQDWSAMRSVGAGLAAQAYWLQGVATSRDPGLVRSVLHFVEAPGATTPSVAQAGTRFQLVAAPSATGWRPPRPSPDKHCDIGICLPQAQAFVPQISSAALHTSYDCAEGQSAACAQDSGQWMAGAQDLNPAVDSAEMQQQAAIPIDQQQSNQQNTPPPLQEFYDRCGANGGTPSTDASGMQRLPTSEGGWRCNTQGGKCWSYLTTSGTEYGGGAAGCPEQGLVPQPGQPPGDALIGGIDQIGTSLPGGGNGPAGPSFDGRYDVRATVSVNESLPPGVAQFLPGGGVFSGGGSATLVVSGNSVQGWDSGSGVQGFPNGPLAIDSTGHASDTESINEQGIAVTFNQTFVFAPDGSSVSGTFNADISGSVEGLSAPVSVSGTLMGTNTAGPNQAPTGTPAPTPTVAPTLPPAPSPDTFTLPPTPTPQPSAAAQPGATASPSRGAVTPAPSPTDDCHPVNPSEHISICVPSWLSGASTGSTMVTGPNGTTQPFAGSLPPGAGLMTGPDSSAAVSDADAQSTLSLAPLTTLVSNVRAVLGGTPPQLITCENSPSNCLGATGQRISSAAYSALKDVFKGNLAMAWYRIGKGEVDATIDISKGIRKAATCLASNQWLGCDATGSNLEATVGSSGSELEVLGGYWVVLNTASGQFVTLTAGQRIFIPSDAAHAAAEDMHAGVGSFDAGSLPQWWVASGPLPGFAWPLIATALAALLAWTGAAVVRRRQARPRSPAARA